MGSVPSRQLILDLTRLAIPCLSADDATTLEVSLLREEVRKVIMDMPSDQAQTDSPGFSSSVARKLSLTICFSLCNIFI
jgi:hypothetical protein